MFATNQWRKDCDSSFAMLTFSTRLRPICEEGHSKAMPHGHDVTDTLLRPDMRVSRLSSIPLKCRNRIQLLLFQVQINKVFACLKNEIFNYFSLTDHLDICRK